MASITFETHNNIQNVIVRFEGYRHGRAPGGITRRAGNPEVRVRWSVTSTGIGARHTYGEIPFRDGMTPKLIGLELRRKLYHSCRSG
jgi:hypothetical protein